MPLGTPILGSAAVVQVNTVTGATGAQPVGGLKTWDYVGDSPSTTDDFYGQASVVTAGKTTRTITLNVVYETADSGHAMIYSAFLTKNTIFFRLMPNGVAGEEVAVKVTHQEVHGPDVNGHTTASWTLGQQADPINIGGGLGLAA
jgi:hypothetical protein